MLTGKTITEHDEATKALPPKYEAARIALTFRDRQMLYDRIDARVDEMMARGLVAEVRALLELGVPRQSSAMQAIGYKEILLALDGSISMAEAAELIKRESRRYAKRQLTWLRRDTGIFWIEWEEKADFDLARRLSTAFLAQCGIK